MTKLPLISSDAVIRKLVSYPKRGVRLNLAVTFDIILGKY